MIYAYFGEFQSQSNRAKAMAYLSLFMGLSLVFLPALSWGIEASHWSMTIFGIHMHSWRLILFLNSLPTLLVALALTRFPESPKFLYHSKNTSKTLSVLREMYAANTGASKDSFIVESLDEAVMILDCEISKEGELIWLSR